ncbi:uncharacterized protein CLUP02_17639 [Colletotrichum lupini]|uniref:Uncharacterized protein n=1 Tax=Colletotrichum lupini TaxID=145971 RepID=A0A9Q8SFG5_9PEZI|nr:uncharacterized protein CLUP02_17639 [Colletotrichum lupini]UQC76128.1 hypothetical protein CLUP02_17639 [Colletotrichum lupini]
MNTYGVHSCGFGSLPSAPSLGDLQRLRHHQGPFVLTHPNIRRLSWDAFISLTSNGLSHFLLLPLYRYRPVLIHAAHYPETPWSTSPAVRRQRRSQQMKPPADTQSALVR